MTHILDFVSNISHYAGPGMIMFVIGVALVVFAITRLTKQRAADRSVTVAEFNRQFLNDTGFSISDVEAGEARKQAASKLGIGTDRR